MHQKTIAGPLARFLALAALALLICASAQAQEGPGCGGVPGGGPCYDDTPDPCPTYQSCSILDPQAKKWWDTPEKGEDADWKACEFERVCLKSKGGCDFAHYAACQDAKRYWITGPCKGCDLP